MSISLALKYSILSAFFVLFIGMSSENILGQPSNATEELEREIKMQQQELEQQLKETTESFNETEQLEGMG
jgi:hypothetical protein